MHNKTHKKRTHTPTKNKRNTNTTTMNKNKLAVMFTSNNHEWETPKELFEKLDSEFHFSLDVCATAQNTKCTKFFNKKTDGLKQDWNKNTCFMNPPYGRIIKEWIKKAHEESLKGTIVVCLLPARTDTSWWHEYIIPFAKEIRFIKGRIKFSNNKCGAPFPSAIIIFQSPEHEDKPVEIYGKPIHGSPQVSRFICKFCKRKYNEKECPNCAVLNEVK